MKSIALAATAAAFTMFSLGMSAEAAAQSAPSAISAEPQIRPGFEKDYRNARKDEAKAQQNLAKAKGDADRARASLIEGERLMTESSAALEAQKSAYKNFAARVGAATTAKAIESEVRALSDIAKLWKSVESSYEDGAKTVKSAQKDLGKSEERRVKAEAKLAKARTEVSAAVIAPEPVIEAAPEILEPSAALEDTSVELKALGDVQDRP